MDATDLKDAATAGSITAGVRRALESEIRSGAIAPGTVLPVKDVAEKFGISRTPAKEALLQLAAGGLVDFQPRRGAVVTKLQPKLIFGMLEVLSVLEAEAARLCARRLSHEQRTELAELHASAGRAVEMGDLEGYRRLNLRLHDVIYAGAENEYLHEKIVEIRSRLAAYRPVSFERPGRMKASHMEHDAVVQAILRGDEPEAHRAMIQHITVGGTAQAELMLRMGLTL